MPFPTFEMKLQTFILQIKLYFNLIASFLLFDILQLEKNTIDF